MDLRSIERLAFGRKGLLLGGRMRILAVDQRGTDIETECSFEHRCTTSKLRLAAGEIERPPVPKHRRLFR